MRPARHFTLVAADPPGYGSSDIPATGAEHTPYTKRAMARVMVQVMQRLGHARFAVAGHDRGARVTYRMALDHAERLTQAAVIDILPTYDYWNRMDRSFALRIYHWAFLAQPHPLPEQLIAADPDAYFTHTLGSWTQAGVDASFDPRALAHYLTSLRDPGRIHAICEDYRAGAYADFEHDRADFETGRRISVPLSALWGRRGIASGATMPLDTWRLRAENVTGQVVDAGHFLPEENPEATADAMLAFFGAD